MIVGIIAGTPVDTRFGIEYFQKHRIQAIGLSISKTPQEQTRFQVLGKEELTAYVDKAIKSLGQIDIVVIYCNSLSGAIDIEKLRSDNDIPIITPLDVYRDIANKHNIIGLIAANCQSTSAIERVILKENPKAIVIGMANLKIVNAIEAKESAEHIIENFGLAEQCDIIAKSGAEIIILGCTHFTYIHEALSHATHATMFEPSKAMLDKINNK
jgi:glutamate racemase